jgi:hypothetical protein
MTVYVIQENSDHNYSAAEEYGEVVFLTADSYSNNNNSLHNRKVEVAIVKGLERFNPESDYLLCAGHPILIGIAFHVVATKVKGEFRCLRWNKLHMRYTALTVFKEQ